MSRMNKDGAAAAIIGIALIVFSVGLMAYNIYSDRSAGRQSDEIAETLRDLTEETTAEGAENYFDADIYTDIADNTPLYEIEPEISMPEKELDGRYYIGVLYIDALDLRLPVMSELSYPGLRKAPCRYKGSAYTRDLIIAAHNYGTHFGRIKNLPMGSSVRLIDLDGNEFDYIVQSIETINGKNVDAMDKGDWDLTLFTCTYGGVDRITLRCVLT